MLLGAYVLGGLSAGEESTVRAHLDRCPQCRAEHSDLARVPGWLDLLGDDKGAGRSAGEHADQGEGGPPER